MSDPEVEYRAARRRFIRSRVRAGVPYVLAASASMLIISALDGASPRMLVFTALLAVLGVPVLYLPLAIVCARLEWRFSPTEERLAAERLRGSSGRLWFDPPAT